MVLFALRNLQDDIFSERITHREMRACPIFDDIKLRPTEGSIDDLCQRINLGEPK